MRKQDIPKFVLILFILCMAMFFAVTFDRSDEKEAKIAKNQALVGQSIVLRDDTLKVYKYSIWHDEFILEDGMRASRELVVTLLVR